MVSQSSERSTKDALFTLHRCLSAARRRDLLMVLGAMAVGTVAEILTIGAVLPFLTLVMATDSSDAGLAGQFFAIIDVLPGATPLHKAALLLICAAVAATAMRLLILRLTLRLALRLGQDIGAEIFGRMLRQSYTFYAIQNTSEALASLDKIRKVVGSVVLPLMQGVVSLAMSILIAIALFLISPVIAAGAVSPVLAAYLLITAIAAPRLQSNSRVLAHTSTARVQTLQQAIGGIRDVIVNRTHHVFEEAAVYLRTPGGITDRTWDRWSNRQIKGYEDLSPTMALLLRELPKVECAELQTAIEKFMRSYCGSCIYQSGFYDDIETLRQIRRFHRRHATLTERLILETAMLPTPVARLVLGGARWVHRLSKRIKARRRRAERC